MITHCGIQAAFGYKNIAPIDYFASLGSSGLAAIKTARSFWI
jgi:hypothetical protein